jgi:hypothetical protein
MATRPDITLKLTASDKPFDITGRGRVYPVRVEGEHETGEHLREAWNGRRAEIRGLDGSVARGIILGVELPARGGPFGPRHQAGVLLDRKEQDDKPPQFCIAHPSRPLDGPCPECLAENAEHAGESDRDALMGELLEAKAEAARATRRHSDLVVETVARPLQEQVRDLREALLESRDYVEAGSSGYCFNNLDVKEVLGRIDALLGIKPAVEPPPEVDKPAGEPSPRAGPATEITFHTAGDPDIGGRVAAIDHEGNARLYPDRATPKTDNERLRKALQEWRDSIGEPNDDHEHIFNDCYDCVSNNEDRQLRETLDKLLSGEPST